jgi:hypothetical protein
MRIYWSFFHKRRIASVGMLGVRELPIRLGLPSWVSLVHW